MTGGDVAQVVAAGGLGDHLRRVLNADLEITHEQLCPVGQLPERRADTPTTLHGNST